MVGSFGAAAEATDAIFSLTGGAEDVDATSVEADGALLAAATGGSCSAGAVADFCAGASARDAALSSSRPGLRPFKDEQKPVRQGADIRGPDRLSQCLGT